MEIGNVNNYKYNSNFEALRRPAKKILPHQNLADFVKYKIPKDYSPTKSLKAVFNIRSLKDKGTTCDGAIELRNFWRYIPPQLIDGLRKMGVSTNRDGYAESFLKTKSNIPISTSYVHDCSAMYLYNEKTKEHALYHALSDCEYDKIKQMIKTLMPQGVTRAAIIPGHNYFCCDHQKNMKQMHKLIRLTNPNAIVNVYHNASEFPEIVGYKGNVFEIPNKLYNEQIKMNNLPLRDYGQASFKIADAQEYYTLDKITAEVHSLKDAKEMKKFFKRKNFSKEMKQILNQKIQERLKVIELIDKRKTIEELEDLRTIYSDSTWQRAFCFKKEQLIRQELEKITSIEQLQNFYQKYQPDYIYLKNLNDELQKKKKTILK